MCVLHRSLIINTNTDKIIFDWYVHSVCSEIPPEDQDSVFATPMPFPEIQFITWRNENDLCESKLTKAPALCLSLHVAIILSSERICPDKGTCCSTLPCTVAQTQASMKRATEETQLSQMTAK